MSNIESVSDAEDVPQLSSETYSALQEFYKEQEERDKKIESIGNYDDVQLDINNFDENWQLSQFWYDAATAESLSNIAIKLAKDGKIALLSCPTLYPFLKQKSEKCEVTLFEYDERFAVYGSDYIFYDYKSPLDIPRNFADSYDVVIADPPFLSDECLTKTAITIKFLAKKNIILCTGAVMTELADRLLSLKRSSFEPKHKNNLGNDFCCFTNFDLDGLI